MQLNFAVGNKISYEGEVYSIKQGLDLHHVLLEEPVSGVTVVAKICNIKLVEESLNNNKPHQELTLISAKDWEIAKYRESIIKPLVKQRGIFQQAHKIHTSADSRSSVFNSSTGDISYPSSLANCFSLCSARIL